MITVVVKVGIAVLLTTCAFVIVGRPGKRGPTNTLLTSLHGIVAVAIFSRAFFFVAIYFVFEQSVPSDVHEWYYPQAKAALAGGVWNSSFASSYAPLFPYVGAVLVKILDSPLVFVIAALCLDVIALWYWTRLLSLVAPGAAIDLSIVYALSAPVILNALVGQQQIWVGAGLAASICLAARRNAIGAGFIQGLTLCATKILVVLFWPLLFLSSNNKTVWLLAAISPPVATAGLFYALGSDFLLGLNSESQNFTSGNIIYYLDFFLAIGRKASWIYDLLTVTSLVCVCVFLMGRGLTCQQFPQRLESVICAAALCLAVFLLMSKKSYANYLSFAYFPLLFVLYKGLPNTWFWLSALFLSIGSSAQPSLWFAGGGNRLWLREWVAYSGWIPVIPTMSIDLVLIVIYGIIIWLSVGLLRSATRKQESPTCTRLEGIGCGGT